MTKISQAMADYIDAITSEWGPLPSGTGGTSLTLKGLEKRGLVQSRIKTPYISYAPWEVRLTEAGAAIKAEQDARRARWHAELQDAIGHD